MQTPGVDTLETGGRGLGMTGANAPDRLVRVPTSPVNRELNVRLNIDQKGCTMARMTIGIVASVGTSLAILKKRLDRRLLPSAS